MHSKALTDGFDADIPPHELKARLFKLEQDNMQLWSEIASLKRTTDLQAQLLIALGKIVNAPATPVSIKLPKAPEKPL